MIRKLFMVLMCCFTLSTWAACTPAAPTNTSNFCQSFKTVAPCYCAANGVPSIVCNNMSMELLYKRMISYYGSLGQACHGQKNTTPQDCLNNWNCYRLGGKDSQGRLCSGTGKACS